MILSSYALTKKGLQVTVIAVFMVAGLGLSSVSLAQSGNDPLAAICHGFLSSSGIPAPGNATVLCGCLVREVQVSLSLSEMQAYQNATVAGRALPPGVERKIKAVATKCLSEAR